MPYLTTWITISVGACPLRVMRTTHEFSNNQITNVIDPSGTMRGNQRTLGLSRKMC
jgi:cobalamin biosynthesis protein CobT